jgi:hypothetical protein
MTITTDPFFEQRGGLGRQVEAPTSRRRAGQTTVARERQSLNPMDIGIANRVPIIPGKWGE